MRVERGKREEEEGEAEAYMVYDFDAHQSQFLCTPGQVLCISSALSKARDLPIYKPGEGGFAASAKRGSLI